MNFDPFFLDAVIGELRRTALGAIVAKVYQPGPAEVVLRLWNGRRNLQLLLGVAPQSARIHLIERKLPNPARPPRFAQLLRSRLGRLARIERLAGQRIVALHFCRRDGTAGTLIADLRGSRGELLLLDEEGRIVDSLLRRPEAVRGAIYLPPAAPPGHHLLENAIPDPPQEEPLAAWLMRSVFPMSETAAADLQAAEEAGMDPREALERLRDRWRGGDFRPAVVRRRQKPILCAWPPDFLELEEVTLYSGPSEAAETFYSATAGEAVFDAGPEELSRTVRRTLRKLHKRLDRIAADRSEALRSERHREIGDLLLANRHRLAKGMEEVVLEDWYADPPRKTRIELDPALSPQENIEVRFRRHRKAKRALEHVERRHRETRAEIEWLEGIALALEQAGEPVEFQEIRREMVAEGLLRDRQGAAAPRIGTRGGSAVCQATTPGGYTLYWGRNNRANDHVTRRLTAADDLWFHAHNIPGCHLVLKRQKREESVPEADLLVAAAVAAANSRGREDARVEVLVAEGKEVRKPKGARPGMVVVGSYRTLRVQPQDLPSSPYPE